MKSGNWCDAHKHLKPKHDRRGYHRIYDQHRRDAAAKAFYNSPAWQNARREKLSNQPVCERCRRTWANTVHNIKPLKASTSNERIAQENLMSTCTPCHGIIEAEVAAAKAAH